MTAAARPTVLFVTVPAALGGSNRALLTLLEALEGQVDRVVAAPEQGAMAYTVDADLLAEGYLGLRQAAGAGRFLRFANAMRIARWVWVRRRSLHGIHANATTGLYMALPAALATGVPLTVWVHDSVSTPWGRRLGRLIGGRLRRVEWAAVSSVASEVIIANGLAAPDHVHIVPNPVSRDVVLARERIPPVGDRVRIGFLGAATRAKGFDLLPEVARLTADLPITWKLFVNRKDLAEEAPIWAAIDAAGADVEVFGRIHDVRDAYAQCDVVFNPSRFESFSRVTAEALINGIPVVASDIAPMRDLLGDSDAGMLFQSSNAAEAAEVIRSVVGDRNTLERMREACRNVELEFEPGAVASQLLDLYGSAHGSERYEGHRRR